MRFIAMQADFDSSMVRAQNRNQSILNGYPIRCQKALATKGMYMFD